MAEYRKEGITLIIQFIQSLYNNPSTIPIKSTDYEQLLEDIEFFSISAQIYHLLKKHNLLNQTPHFFQEKLKNNCTNVLYRNIFIKSEWEKITSLFEESEIATIPLKGVTFAEKYFRDLGARSTSDIDILIRPPNINQATSILQSLGFIIEQDLIPSHFHCSFSKNLPNSTIPLTVELHWNIMREDTASLDIEDFWREAQPLKHYHSIFELSDYHTFYMICLHGWRHNLDSLKYFIDIMQLIYVIGDKVDYHKLFQDAISDQTYTRLVRTLSIVYNQFPELHRIKKFGLSKPTPRWEYRNIRYPKNRNINRYVDFIDYQFFSFDKIKHSFVEMRNIIIPLK
ncbi:nucleotidyltransferase family protein [Gottfriedia solisilvae]|uniref:nucleotidyltransferase family protein n=1 Tax=Gottfriedia solisilvae TaxID=1516104 RepID=UPI003D2F0BEA